MIAKIKNLINFFKENKELGIVVLFILIMVVVLVVESIYPKSQRSSTATDTKFSVAKNTNQIVWEQAGLNIVPGQTKYQDIEDTFTGYEGRRSTRSAVVYRYTSIEGQYDETEVGVDNNGIVKYLDLKIHPFKKVDLSVYETKYGLGNPDIIKEIKEIDGTKAYVYLEKGLILYIRVSDNKVRNEIYFIPMPENEFNVFWGYKLTENHDLEELNKHF